MDENEKKAAASGKKGEKLRSGLAKALGEATAGAKAIVEKAQTAVSLAADVNGDGKLDMADVGKLADEAGKGIRRGGEYLSNAAAEAKLVADLRQYRPVFPAEILSMTAGEAFVNPLDKMARPSMIRIVDRDKKREETEACAGAAGYRTLVKGLDILNLYEDWLREGGSRLTFFPCISKTFFYADPCRDGIYIALDEYFQYMKRARISELERVAKDLGAKRFSIVLKEQKKTFVAKNAKGGAKYGKNGAEVSGDMESREYSSVGIASQSEFSGHNDPVRPELVYYKNESDMESLVAMRMDVAQGNQLKTKTYSLQYNNNSGIKEKEALSIDAALSQMKCGGTATISSEAQNESRITLEYTIEF